MNIDLGIYPIYFADAREKRLCYIDNKIQIPTCEGKYGLFLKIGYGTFCRPNNLGSINNITTIGVF